MSDYDALASTSINRNAREMPRKDLPPGLVGVLEVLDGPDKGKTYELTKAWSSIGRGPANEVVLHDNAASVKHCEIFFARSMEWRIGDLNSTNGTLLNGHVVKGYSLKNGDKILIGSTLFLFTIQHN